MDIKVDVKEGEGCNILNVCGDVDVYTSPKVKESINALIEKEIYNKVDREVNNAIQKLNEESYECKDNK